MIKSCPACNSYLTRIDGVNLVFTCGGSITVEDGKLAAKDNCGEALKLAVFRLNLRNSPNLDSSTRDIAATE